MKPYITGLALGAILLSGCYKQSEFDPLDLDPDKVIERLQASPDTLPANGTSTSVIIALLPKGGREGADVSFTTSRGIFTENGTASCSVKTKVAMLDGEVRVFATATLRSTQTAGVATVSAKLGDYEKQLTVSMGANLPTSLALSVPSLIMESTPASEVEITALLTSATGPVTIGQIIEMQVLDTALVSRGSFRVEENQSNTEGKCRFVFSIMPDTAYTGPLTIYGSTAGASGPLQDSLTIYILN